jgi:hypothetical protein
VCRASLCLQYGLACSVDREEMVRLIRIDSFLRLLHDLMNFNDGPRGMILLIVVLTRKLWYQSLGQCDSAHEKLSRAGGSLI